MMPLLFIKCQHAIGTSTYLVNGKPILSNSERKTSFGLTLKIFCVLKCYKQLRQTLLPLVIFHISSDALWCFVLSDQRYLSYYS